MPGKKKYTVPIMLVIITLLTFLIVVLFSRVLLDGQSLKTERGERLAASYNYCLLYANALKETADGLLEAGDDASRMQAARAQGKLELAGGECAAGVLVQAGTRSGLSEEAATSAASAPLRKIEGALQRFGTRIGALTDEERTSLTAAAAAADKLAAELRAYTPPTGADRFRQMQAGVDWVPVVQRFIKELNGAAAAIG
ncbi:hypothetical protein [Cohnella sp. JJ-181]|uniref:hypothetical protein n=1 Tax=Cohnella rhizoplanae TaxID=2974897 RepID=UPI0022FF5244|nr:hypothetical protein [Cohnella sp. JJ-181]CAI6018004.1 hypothetical protein COHCIP112018_00187 [Cohnella sp. JJ-181]